ncbi:acetyltransferase component of pyruvate dehydrogenase complex [Spirochaetia bacterium]|nr:acetyltransferase component of pyruvate dehydrogenase complex [Spirochaetia bacterium]
MAYLLIMPRQGNTVESCVITGIKVKEGDVVSAETIVYEVETDKATFEIPAGSAGTVLKLLHAEGDDVPVLEPIAVIGSAGEDWAGAVGSTEKTLPASPETPPVKAPVQQAVPVLPLDAHGAISPRAKNLAAGEGVGLDGIQGSGPGGRIIERDIKAALQDKAPLSAAAKAAGAATIPASGSGLAGRVILADLTTPQTSDVPVAATLHVRTEGAVTETPIKGIRKLIADRMYQSLAESAQFTLNASAPAQQIQEFRKRAKAADESLGLGKITVNDLILFAVSRVLPVFPFMNAHKIGDTLRTFERVHLGVAVDTPKGLMVPVIKNADLLSLRNISAEAKRLAAAAQGGSVKPDELTGSTFTVTNLGSLGVTNFTPVLNAPEVAILGVCNIELKPVESAGEIAFEPHIGLSLTINHQVVDGAPAARFLKAFGDALATIDLWFARG